MESMDTTDGSLVCRLLLAREKNLGRLNKRYHLARSLGFSSYEAVKLQGRKEEFIIRLAKELGKKSVVGQQASDT